MSLRRLEPLTGGVAALATLLRVSRRATTLAGDAGWTVVDAFRLVTILLSACPSVPDVALVDDNPLVSLRSDRGGEHD